MHLRSLTALFVALAMAVSAAADEKKQVRSSSTWQPMLAKSFEADTKKLRVSGLTVDRNVGCVFLSVDGKGVHCSSAGANRFSPNKKTWEQVLKLRSDDLQHKFILTKSGIRESRDGGETWSQAISAPKGFVITEKTWFAYDAKHDNLYLMKAGSELYKLARGKVRVAAK
jgi:hypothetical protein